MNFIRSALAFWLLYARRMSRTARTFFSGPAWKPYLLLLGAMGVFAIMWAIPKPRSPQVIAYDRAVGVGAPITLPSQIKFNQNTAGSVPVSLASKLSNAVSVKDFGAVGDGVTDDSTAIANTLTAAGANQAIDFSCPGNYKTTAYGTIPCGDYYPPDGSAGSFPRSLPAKIQNIRDVRDWGAKGDGVADDTVAFQAALTAISGTAGKNLLVPAGTYNISSTLNFKSLRSMQILGDGSRDTILHWTGSAGGTAFLFLNCYRILVQGIRFDRGTNDPAILVEVRQDSGQGDYNSSAPSQLNTFRECTFKNGAFGLGFTFATSDIMNDSHRVEHGLFDGQTTASIDMSGQNVLGVLFDQCYSTNAPHAIQVESAAGSFKWRSGYVNNTVSNFYFISFSSDGYLFDGVRSEQSPRFIEYTGGSPSPGPFVLLNTTYSASALNADTFAIKMTGAGPVSIIGSSWGGVGGSDPVAPRFSIANTPSPISILMTGNSFGATGASTVVPIAAAAGNRVFASGNRYWVSGTTWVTKVEETGPHAGRAATITYTTGVAMNMDAGAADDFKLVVNDAVAVVLNAPTNGTNPQIITIQIKATAALNAASPFGGAGWKAGAFVAPANGFNMIWTFKYDGTNWGQVGTPIQIAN